MLCGKYVPDALTPFPCAEGMSELIALNLYINGVIASCNKTVVYCDIFVFNLFSKTLFLRRAVFCFGVIFVNNCCRFSLLTFYRSKNEFRGKRTYG